jgi:hypothetical protein
VKNYIFLMGIILSQSIYSATLHHAFIDINSMEWFGPTLLTTERLQDLAADKLQGLEDYKLQGAVPGSGVIDSNLINISSDLYRGGRTDFVGKLVLQDGFFGISNYHLSDLVPANLIPQFDSLEYAFFDKTSLSFSQKSAALKSTQGSVRFAGKYFEFSSIDFFCDPALGLSQKRFLEFCLNRSYLKSLGEPARLMYQDSAILLKSNFNALTIYPDSFQIDGREIFVSSAGNRSAIENFDITCKKGEWGKEITGDTILKGCLDDSVIDIDQISFANDQTGFSGTLPLERISIDGPKLEFESNLFTIGNPDTSISFGSISAYCSKGIVGDNFKVSDMINWCLSESELFLEKIKVENECFDIDGDIDYIGFKKNQLSITSPTLNYSTEDLDIDVTKLEVSCSRGSSGELTLESMSEGCFDSSTINVQKVEFKSKGYSATVDIEEISIDKNRFKLKIPQGSYTLNGVQSTVKNLSFDCGIDAKITDLKELNIENILENCMKDSVIEIGSIVSAGNKKFKLLKLQAANKVKLISKDNQFELVAHPKLKVIGIRGPNLRVDVSGSISMNRDDKSLNIHIQKSKMSRILPLKDFILFMFKAFSKMDNVTINGDDINIELAFLNKDKNTPCK